MITNDTEVKPVHLIDFCENIMPLKFVNITCYKCNAAGKFQQAAHKPSNVATSTCVSQALLKLSNRSYGSTVSIKFDANDLTTSDERSFGLTLDIGVMLCCQ